MGCSHETVRIYMNTVKRILLITRISDILSLLLWLLGIGVFVFNLLGKWTAWHLAGFGYYFYFVIPFIASCGAILATGMSDDAAIRKKYILHNGVVLGISTVITILTFFVFCKWFW